MTPPGKMAALGILWRHFRTLERKRSGVIRKYSHWFGPSSFRSSANFSSVIYLSTDELIVYICFVVPATLFRPQRGRGGAAGLPLAVSQAPVTLAPAVYLGEIQQRASGADLASRSQSPFDGAGRVMDLNSRRVLWVPRLLNSWPLA